jgi:hypothetical protein
MPYPEEAEGFQVDSPETYTDFKKRFVSRKVAHDRRDTQLTVVHAVQTEAVRRLWYAPMGTSLSIKLS